jgi:hypothetical protein
LIAKTDKRKGRLLAQAEKGEDEHV